MTGRHSAFKGTVTCMLLTCKERTSSTTVQEPVLQSNSTIRSHQPQIPASEDYQFMLRQMTSKQLWPCFVGTEWGQIEETGTLQLHRPALEERGAGPVKYRFPPLDLKQHEGTRRDLYIPARKENCCTRKSAMGQGRNNWHVPITTATI
jgi:hypothetical protein